MCIKLFKKLKEKKIKHCKCGCEDNSGVAVLKITEETPHIEKFNEEERDYIPAVATEDGYGREDLEAILSDENIDRDAAESAVYTLNAEEVDRIINTMQGTLTEEDKEKLSIFVEH